MNLASVRARVHSPSCQRTANSAPYIALMPSFIITQCMWWFPGAQRDLWEREAMMVMWMAGCLRSWWSKQAGILDRMMLKCMVCVAGISVCRRETQTTLHAPNVYRRCTPSESLLQTFMLLMTAPSHPTLSSHPKSIHAPNVYRLYTSSESLLWTFSFWCLLHPPPSPVHSCSQCIQNMHTEWARTAHFSLLMSALPHPLTLLMHTGDAHQVNPYCKCFTFGVCFPTPLSLPDLPITLLYIIMGDVLHAGP